MSGAGAPDTPDLPRVNARSATIAMIEWTEPSLNGAMVTEYRLQQAIVSSRKCLSPPPLHLDNDPGLDEEVSSQSMSSSTSSLVDDEEEFDDYEDDNQESDEHQESLDSDDDHELAKKRVVKRKRKSFRNEEENSDSDEDEDNSHRNTSRGHGRESTSSASNLNVFPSRKASSSSEMPIKSTTKELSNEDLQDDDELPKELLFRNIYTGLSLSFEARYV